MTDPLLDEALKHARTAEVNAALAVAFIREAMSPTETEPPTRPPTRPPTEPEPVPPPSGGSGMEGVTVESVDSTGRATLGFEGISVDVTVFGDGSISAAGWAPWDAPDPATATIWGRENAEKYQGRYVTPNDANEGGGAGIYFENEWAAGCSIALQTCHDIAVQWANRMPLARLDWDALVKGEIRAFDWGEDHLGLDRSRNLQPAPFALKDSQGRRILDHSHTNRAVLATGYAAKNGNAFCRFMSWCYAQDVRASWTLPNLYDSKKNALLWSAHGIMQNTPRGIGSPILGREFDGALRALVAAIECGFEEFKADLMLLAKLAVYCFDHDDQALYVIYPQNEHGHPSSKYKHKVYDEGWSHSIPAGAQPPVCKTFEVARVYLGLKAAQRVLHWAPLDTVILGLNTRLHADNSQLAVIGHPEWSSTEQTPYTDLILGQNPGNLDELQRANTPWWGDHKLSAYTGEWS